MAAPPFTAARVSRFLALCLGAMLLFWGLYFLLTHATAREGIKPSGAQGRLSVPGQVPSGVAL